ncbi:MAG TPA: UbiA family prenyltransferase [Planctomycetaceae bacterium]|nr:UbiA family prenyltransferase [Planctomycetaceae bacterium]
MVTRPWLQLVRLPAVFTAMADIFCGFLLAHGTLAPNGCPLDFALLLGASSCLYMAGMVFNDVFDRRIDAVERPLRPIPSGTVSLRAASILGGLLVIGGVAAAAVVGAQSLLVALGLTACIFVYDGLLKGTPLGPLAMGGCRFLNIMLGASAVASAADLWRPPQLCVAGALGVYITGVTWFARNEARQSGRGPLAAAMLVINAGLAALAALVLLYPWTSQPAARDRQVVFLILAVSLLSINRRLTAAVLDPSPARVQPAVRTMILSLIVLDASILLIATRDPLLAGATVALLIPAAVLGRWVFVT